MRFYILATAAICMFCQFGALGAKDDKITLICLLIPFIAVGLCVWRCTAIARRRSERREHERQFQMYMRHRRTSR